jgi:hypothetical protein
VVAHRGDHLLEINQVVGVLGGGPQTVIGADTDPALAGESVEQREGLAVLSAVGIATAVEMDQDRATRWMGAVTIQVEKAAAAGVAVEEVCHPLDAQAAARQRQEQDAVKGSRRRSRAASSGSMAVRQSAPRASAMARSSAGLACSPRQATTARSAVVKAANPTVPSRLQS